MKYTHNRFLLAFIAIILMIIMLDRPSISAEQYDPPMLLNFSDEVKSKEFYVDLDGEWDFFEKKLLSPDEVNEQLNKEQGKTVSLPSSFETQTGEINSFGTYSTRIKIPKEYVGETLAIHIPFQYSAYALFIDQTKVAKNGVVGKNQPYILLKWLRKQDILLRKRMNYYSRCKYLALTIFGGI